MPKNSWIMGWHSGNAAAYENSIRIMNKVLTEGVPIEMAIDMLEILAAHSQEQAEKEGMKE